MAVIPIISLFPGCLPIMGKVLLLSWVCSVEQSTVVEATTLSSFKTIIFALNINSLYFALCVCVCVCMFIFGVVSIVVFCVLYSSSFAHRASLKISIWLLSGPLFKNYNYSYNHWRATTH